MRAASWDITWEVGSPWKTLLRRRDLTDAPLPLFPPCLLEVRAFHAPSTASTLEVVTGVLDVTTPEDPRWMLYLPGSRTLALGPGTFEHRLLLGQGGGETEIWARGYVRARDRAGDTG